MIKLLTAASLLAAVSVTGIAVAEKPIIKPDDTVTYIPATPVGPPEGPPSLDARSVASDRAVGEARRAYRNACNQHESAAFCECLTAGVAQALPPHEVRMAANAIGARISAQGDLSYAGDASPYNDPPVRGEEQPDLLRIEQVEGHYADSCAPYRR